MLRDHQVQTLHFTDEAHGAAEPGPCPTRCSLDEDLGLLSFQTSVLNSVPNSLNQIIGLPCNNGYRQDSLVGFCWGPPTCRLLLSARVSLALTALSCPRCTFAHVVDEETQRLNRCPGHVAWALCDSQDRSWSF